MERLQREFPDVHLVKAFSSVGNARMIDPQFAGGRPTMFICRNDERARVIVAPPGLRSFSALAVSPSLSVGLRRWWGRWGPHTPSNLRVAPCDLPKIGSNVADVNFSAVC